MRTFLPMKLLLYFGSFFSLLVIIKFSSSLTANASGIMEYKGMDQNLSLEENFKNNLTTTETLTLPTSTPNEIDPVSETLRILAAGEREIVLNDKYRDIVLVLGNTGAGKSTITQFLAGNNSNLTSYEAEDGHYLVRDFGNKISFGTTLISKSIFPELVIHKETGTAYYDCPGFSDTRNVSVEIANAFFIKKVAHHARRLKLLFVVNHSSVKSGESRNDFKSLIQQSTILLKEAQKFENGTALIVTKVDSSRSDHSLIKGVANFLATARQDLVQLLPAHNDQLKNAQDLIDSFLVKDGENYSKIGLFRQPDELGPLSEIDVIQEAKMKLETIIFDLLQFVQKTVNGSDFRVSVSDSAKLIVLKLGRKFHDSLSHRLTDLAVNFQTEFKSKMDNSNRMRKIDLLPDLQNDLNCLMDLTKILESSGQKDRNQFFETIFNYTVVTRNDETRKDCSQMTKEIFKNIDLDLQKLNFLDQVSDDQSVNPPIPHTEWLHPFTLAIEELSGKFYSFQLSIDAEVFHACVEVAQILKNHLEKILPTETKNVYKTKQEFQKFYKIISALLKSLKNCTDLKSFSTHLITSVSDDSLAGIFQKIKFELDKICPKNDAPPILLLVDQLDAKKKSPYNPSQWTQPFEEVENFVEHQNFILAQKTNEFIQNLMDNLGSILNHHFSALVAPPEGHKKEDLLIGFSSEFLTLSTMLKILKEANSLKEFSQEIENGFEKLGVEICQNFKNLSNFYKIEGHNINVFDAVSFKASPFQPFEWIRPLAHVSEFLHKKISDLTHVIEEEKRVKAENEAKEKILEMEKEMERLKAAQEEETKRREQERQDWLRLEGEREREEKAEADRLARQREALVQIHRYYNRDNGDHFYTTDWNEIGHGKWAYVYEGVAGKLYPSQVEGCVPLYRYYSGGLGDHFYTTNWSELGGGRIGYKYEGVAGFVHQEEVKGAIPLYRYWSGRDHFYTTNWNEINNGSSARYTFEGIQAYIFP